MKTKVYYNGKPCIQEVALSMAKSAKQTCELLPPSYMPEGLTLAFIGSSDKGGKPNKEVLEFIGIIDPKRVEYVALYATSSGDAQKVIAAMKEAVQARGVTVLDETFVCQGKGSFGGKMPTPEDLARAAAFVTKTESSIPQQ